MAVQIPLGEEARAPERVLANDVREVRPDLAYLRTLLVNVAFVGLPEAGSAAESRCFVTGACFW